MNDKLTLQELINLLAARHQMEPHDADAFVREFWALIEEGLRSDNYVKIKGLGTFKLIDTEARESINIQTGERIEIQSHARVTFTPEASLRDLINRPFAHFETVVLNDSTNFDDLNELEDKSDVEDEEEVEMEIDVPGTESSDDSSSELESSTDELAQTSDDACAADCKDTNEARVEPVVDGQVSETPTCIVQEETDIPKENTEELTSFGSDSETEKMGIASTDELLAKAAAVVGVIAGKIDTQDSEKGADCESEITTGEILEKTVTEKQTEEHTEESQDELLQTCPDTNSQQIQEGSLNKVTNDVPQEEQSEHCEAFPKEDIEEVTEQEDITQTPEIVSTQKEIAGEDAYQVADSPVTTSCSETSHEETLHTGVPDGTERAENQVQQEEVAPEIDKQHSSVHSNSFTTSTHGREDRPTEQQIETEHFCTKSKRRLSWCVVTCALLVGIVIGGFACLYIMFGNTQISENFVHSITHAAVNDNRDSNKNVELDGNQIDETSESDVKDRLVDVSVNKALSDDSIEVCTDDADVPQDIELYPNEKLSTYVEEDQVQKLSETKEEITVKEKNIQREKEKSVIQPEEKKVEQPKYLSEKVRYKITGTIANHTLRRGETLTKISLKYYGNKKIWPYLVKHNKNVIKDPNNVPIGSILRIPQLTPVETR